MFLYDGNILFVQSEDARSPLFQSLQLGTSQADQRNRAFRPLGI